MIKKNEVKHIAKLARLGLTKKELKIFQKELSSILEYIEKLKKVDVSNIGPTSHSIEIKNVIREDKECEKINNKKLLELMPEIKKGYLKVKSILR